MRSIVYRHLVALLCASPLLIYLSFLWPDLSLALAFLSLITSVLYLRFVGSNRIIYSAAVIFLPFLTIFALRMVQGYFADPRAAAYEEGLLLNMAKGGFVGVVMITGSSAVLLPEFALLCAVELLAQRRGWW